MWAVLFRLIKLVISSDWLKRPEIQFLCERITSIFNLFITYGDIFLPDGSDYDFLYYELIRVSALLDQFHELVEKQTPKSVLFLQTENIKTITVHFRTKINKWAQKHPEKGLTPNEVTNVIRNNYESLKLTLLDNLDSYLPFSENSESAFLKQILKTLIFDFKSTISISKK